MATENARVDYVDQNRVMETLARLNLSAYETRILWFVMRQTWGWRMKDRPLSVSFIEQGTGLARQNVSKAKKKLLERRLLFQAGTRIGINPNTDEWVSSPKMIADSHNSAVIHKDDIIPMDYRVSSPGIQSVIPIDDQKGSNKEVKEKESAGADGVYNHDLEVIAEEIKFRLGKACSRQQAGTILFWSGGYRQYDTLAWALVAIRKTAKFFRSGDFMAAIRSVLMTRSEWSDGDWQAVSDEAKRQDLFKIQQTSIKLGDLLKRV